MHPISSVRRVILALALLALAPQLAPAQTEPAERAVYRAVLSRFLRPEIRRIVLSDSTRTVQLRRYDVEQTRTWRMPFHIVEEFNRRNAFVTDELLESFNQRNATSIAVTDSLILAVPVELIGAKEVRAIHLGPEADEWDGTRRRLPGSPGIVYLSRVGFSPEMDRALVYVYLDCGSRCGQGSEVLLRWRDGDWQIEQWLTTLWS